MGREDAVVKHEIDPRARRQSRQLLEELQRLEQEMTRAVRPRGLEREQNAAVAQESEAVLRDRRAQQIPAELLEARAVPGGHGDVGMEVEADVTCSSIVEVIWR